MLGALLDLCSQFGYLNGQRCLLAIHLLDPAGEHDPQARTHLIAERGIALRLRGLALEGTHLASYFFEDVIDPGEILFRLFEAKLRQPLTGFESGDPGCFLDNRAPVVRLGTKELPDALLFDDGVGLRTKAGAHEDVLNVAQAAKLAVEQIFAFAGAEQAAGDYDLALPGCRALEAPAADFEDYGVFCCLVWSFGSRWGCFDRRTFYSLAFYEGTGLNFGDDLFCLRCALAPILLFVPVSCLRFAIIRRFARVEEWTFRVGFGVNEGERNFGHAQRFALAGAGKDDVFHLGAAEAFGGLLAEHPAHRVEDVRFAAAIRTHHDRDPLTRECHLCAITEGLEPQHLDLFKLQHGRVPLALEKTLAIAFPRSNMDTPTCCG